MYDLISLEEDYFYKYYWCLHKFVEYRTLLRYFTWKRLLSIYKKMPVSIWVVRLKKTNREHKTYLNTYDKPQIKLWTNNNNIFSYCITYSRCVIPEFKVFKNIYSRGFCFVWLIFHFTKFLYISTKLHQFWILFEDTIQQEGRLNWGGVWGSVRGRAQRMGESSEQSVSWSYSHILAAVQKPVSHELSTPLVQKFPLFI